MTLTYINLTVTDYRHLQGTFLSPGTPAWPWPVINSNVVQHHSYT